MRLVITDPAADDLESIVDYFAADNPPAAENVANAVDATIRHLCDFPEMGHAGYLPATRQFVVPGLPYVIVYQVATDTLTVLAVFHGARDLARALRERVGKEP